MKPARGSPLPGLKVDVEEFAFPEAMAIRDYDIGVILGNALDNAVEACPFVT